MARSVPFAKRGSLARGLYKELNEWSITTVLHMIVWILGERSRTPPRQAFREDLYGKYELEESLAFAVGCYEF